MNYTLVEPRIASRFRGFLPVVVDVETGGFNAGTDALLEIAAVIVEMTPMGQLRTGATFRYHIQPFHGSRIDPASLAVNGIDPHHPLRPAMPEKEAITQLFREVRKAVREQECTRAVLVGHNASFDLGFLNAVVARTDIKRNPFHPFSSFDTATLGGVAYGARARRGSGRPRLGHERGALGDLRCRAHRRAVLHDLQPVPRHVRGGAGAVA
jgi:ribonuclease T